KNAVAPAIQPASGAPEIWSEARIALPCAPGAENAVLDDFSRLCRIPLARLDAPRSGPLGTAVWAWLAANPVDAPSRPGLGEHPESCPPSRSSSRPNATNAPGPAGAARIERHANVAWRVLDGTAVLVSPSSPTVQTLNSVGTRVWELADGRTVDEIVEAVVKE